MAKTFRYDFSVHGEPLKNFPKRVYEISEAIDKASEADVAPLRDFVLETYTDKPLIVFGSGGSQSSAFYLTELCNRHGIPAQAMTPYMVHGIAQETMPHYRYLGISASGRTTDINATTQSLLDVVPDQVAALTIGDPQSKNPRQLNKLFRLLEKYPSAHNLNCNLNIHSDGFVGTRKHAAFFTLFYHVFHNDTNISEQIFNDAAPYSFTLADGQNWADIDGFHLLYSPMSQSAAVDLESRFSETSLGYIMPTDMKNFTHGRHCFMARHPKSCIVALETPWDAPFAEKILSLYPETTNVVRISSPLDVDLAPLDLLVRSCYFAMDLAAALDVNIYKPKPKPDYGTELWKMDYTDYFAK